MKVKNKRTGEILIVNNLDGIDGYYFIMDTENIIPIGTRVKYAHSDYNMFGTIVNDYKNKYPRFIYNRFDNIYTIKFDNGRIENITDKYLIINPIDDPKLIKKEHCQDCYFYTSDYSRNVFKSSCMIDGQLHNYASTVFKCNRYPESIDKNPLDFCGEFKGKD